MLPRQQIIQSSTAKYLTCGQLYHIASCINYLSHFINAFVTHTGHISRSNILNPARSNLTIRKSTCTITLPPSMQSKSNHPLYTIPSDPIRSDPIHISANASRKPKSFDCELCISVVLFLISACISFFV